MIPYHVIKFERFPLNNFKYFLTNANLDSRLGGYMLALMRCAQTQIFSGLSRSFSFAKQRKQLHDRAAVTFFPLINEVTGPRYALAASQPLSKPAFLTPLTTDPVRAD